MAQLARILCVDDEPMLRRLVRMALETLDDYTVRVCDSGGEALEVAPDFRPDLVLLDVRMPGLDGPATMAKLREIRGLEDTPVIFLTAQTLATEVERFKRLGALEVIPKPFDPATLGQRVRAIWQGHMDSAPCAATVPESVS